MNKYHQGWHKAKSEEQKVRDIAYARLAREEFNKVPIEVLAEQDQKENLILE